MKLVVCIDNRGGWSFNDRRQSRDAEVNKRILQMAEGRSLFVEHYTAKMLHSDMLTMQSPPNVDLRPTTSDPTIIAQDHDVVFAESFRMLDPYMRYNEVVIFIWDKNYPYDTRFPVSLQETTNWQLYSKTQFEGRSHSVVTEEHYVPVAKVKYRHVL